MDDFYSKLSCMCLLKEAWHLAHKEVRGDNFILDALNHSDFGFHRIEYLKFISRSLKNESYDPHPLRRIDVPKSNYAVRPGSVASLEDRIVLYAIALLIAPKLDEKLPPFVRSWRVKGEHDRKGKKSELFEKRLPEGLLNFRFLKSKTISYYIDIFEPWYNAWPVFTQEMVNLYDEGYRYMVKTDVVSYFENIELALLRETLIEYLGQDQKRIVNFLMRFLSYWAWPAINLLDAPRGMPQGNDFSRFLGNFYLIPLDQQLAEFSEKNDIKPLRYMDDITVFAKDRYVLRQCFLEMNTKLRELRLNLSGAKTEFLEGNKVKEELSDSKMEYLNSVMESIVNLKDDDKNAKNRCARTLKNLRKSMPTAIKTEKESRYYRRIVTAHSLLQDPGMIERVLGQINRNADFRILISAHKYFRRLTGNFTTIPKRVLNLLDSQKASLFDFQRAWLFTILRYTRINSDRVFPISKLVIDNDEIDRYTKEQAAILYGTRILNATQKRYIVKNFKKEILPASKRAWIHGLSQLSQQKLKGIASELLMDTEPAMHRVGRMIDDLINNEQASIEHLKHFFKDFESSYLVRQSALVDRIWEIDVLSKNQHPTVKEKLLHHLQQSSAMVKLPFLKQRLANIQQRLENECSNS